MNGIPPLKGLIAATYTPLHQDCSIRLECIGPMVESLINDGVSGLYVCGSTGEGMSLDLEERRQVVEAFVEAAKGRIPVIANVGRNCLTEARSLAAHALEAGADTISATCPFYYKIDRVETLVDCMAEVASGAPSLPFYYYHIPALTGIKLDMVEFLEQGAKRIPNLVGIKYTEPFLHEFQSCQVLRDGKFDIVWGCDEMLLGALATGARAAIGSTYNVAAPLYVRLMQAFSAGQIDEANRLQHLAVMLVEALATYPYHPAMKELFKMLGRDYGPCRLPMPALAPEEVASLHDKLEAIEFFQWQELHFSDSSTGAMANDSLDGESHSSSSKQSQQVT